MISTWRSLFWKEWREHRWKVGALAIVTLLAPTLAAIWQPQEIFSATTLALFLAVPLGAMFLGMSAAAGEHSRGTIHFLQALPTPTSRPAVAKLFWGCLTLAIPTVLGVLGADFWTRMFASRIPMAYASASSNVFSHVWGLNDWYSGTLASGVLAGLSIFVWIAACGANRSDEVRAGAVGLLVVLSYWAAVLLFASQLDPDRRQPVLQAIMSAGPGGPAGVAQLPRPDSSPVAPANARAWLASFGPYAAAAIASHLALAVVFILRYGRVAAPRVQVADAPLPASTAPAWLPPPRRSPLAAIVWKQFRETAPLAVMGAAVVILAAAWAAASHRDATRFAEDFAEITSGIWLAVGACVAMVAGIGLLMDDLRPQLHTFWRSRPIDVRQWFVAKFAIGAATTLLILAIPMSVVAAFLPAPAEERLILLGVGLLSQLGLFATAVAAMVLIRQAVYAAVVAMGVAFAYTMAIAAMTEALKHLPDEPLLIVGVLAGITAATWLAWQAVRHDWGWKS